MLWRHYRETPWVRWCAEGDQLGGSSGQRLRPQAVAVTAWSTQLISRSVPQHEGGFPFIPYFKTFKNCTTNNNKRCFIGTKINYVIHLLHYVIHHERSRSSVSRALLRDTGISTGQVQFIDAWHQMGKLRVRYIWNVLFKIINWVILKGEVYSTVAYTLYCKVNTLVGFLAGVWPVSQPYDWI